jgi:AraC family transcriptional regulator
MAESTISSEPAMNATPVGCGIAAGNGGHDSESRTRLLDVPVSLVEDLRRGPHERSAEDFCQKFQVCLPYRGLGVWYVGGDEVVANANQVLFVRGGESYRLSGPVPGGYAELIITPDIEILLEVARCNRAGLFGHRLFRRRYGRATLFLQNFRTRFLHWARGTPDVDDLEAEEIVVALLRSALQEDGNRLRACGAATSRLIRRTKAFLEAQLPNQIRLVDVGRAVGASPAYLTDVFTKVEGVSLHQYLTQLRLSRALAELPHTDNLTTLALETGFSSHSHFSAAFRRAFGCTPSEFRETTRRAAYPPIAVSRHHRHRRVSA